MSQRMKKYWAIRTDRDNMELLFSELQAGHLRQGWGYDQKQDLNVIWAEKERGGEWWKRLDSSQEAALPNMHMLGKGEEDIRLGDIILLPNLPDLQSFCIAEVCGSYVFQRIKLTDDQDINEVGADYGHILPVKLITPKGINRHHVDVNAQLRSTMRTPMRMWNVDYYGRWIQQLIERVVSGDDLSSPASGEEKLMLAVGRSLKEAKKTFKAQLMKELTSKFQGGEWEEPVVEAMSRLYPGAVVQWTGGPGEHGADVVVSFPNYFGDQKPWLILIQMKNYSDEIGAHVMGQITDAYSYYGEQGEILRAVIMTTADRGSSEFERQKKEFEKAHKAAKQQRVDLVANEQFADLLAEAFMVPSPSPST